MANSTRKMNVEIGFMANKKSLEDLKLQLNGAIAALKQNSVGNEGLKQDVKVATELQQILNKCYNADLGTVNIGKFSTELKKANISVGEIRQSLAKAGNSGVVAFDNLQRQILSTKMEIKESSKVLNDMAKTFYNAFKYNIATKAIQTVTGSLERAVGYAEQLDHSLNDIRIVTDKSAESMEKFAKDANKASKQLGSSTLDYTNASLIYYQQGLSDSEVKARTETTLKVANVTGQTGDQVSEELTAVWNGYKVSAEEAETYVDKLAAVAATTASDLEELSTGMSKVASAAASMGVDVDQLNGMLSTIISVTRQAPESAGTALKTIFARMGDLELDGEDEYGVKLGEVSSSLASMGVQLLDTKGNMRDLGEVIEEVGNKWNSGAWSDAEKQALAIDLAGKRQYNNLLALFDNWQMYNSAVQTSADSVGTLQHQQDIYLESTDAKLTQLKATWQGLYDTIIDNGELNKGIEGLTNVVDAFEKMLAGLGGGMKSIAGFGLMISNIFNKQISEGLLKVKKNAELAQRNVNALNFAKQAANEKIEGPITGVQGRANHAAAEKQAELYREIEPLVKTIDEDQYNNLITEIDKTAELEKQLSLQKSIQGELDKEISKNKELSDVFKKQFESKRQELAQDTDYEKATDAQLDAATYEKMGEEAQEELDKLRESLKTEHEEYEKTKNKRDSDFNRIDRNQEKRSSDKINRSVANINTGTQDFVNNTLDWKRTKDGKGVNFVNSNGQYKSEKEMENLFSSQIKALEEKIASEEKILEEADGEASEVIKDQIKKLKEKLEETKKALESSIEDAQKIVSSSTKGNGILSEKRADIVEEKTKNAVRQYQDDFEKSATKYANESKEAENEHNDTVKDLEKRIEVQEGIVKYAEKGLEVASQTAETEAKILAQEQKTKELARDQAEDNYYRSQVEAIQGVSAGLVSAISLSKSFVSVWEDSDLSFGDKLVQSFTSLTFTLPQIINSFSKINKLHEAAKSAMAARASLAAILNTEEAKESITLIAKKAAQEGCTKEILEQTIQEKFQNKLTKEQIQSLVKQLAIEKEITEEKAGQIINSEMGKNLQGPIEKITKKLATFAATTFGKIFFGALMAGAVVSTVAVAIWKKAERTLDQKSKDAQKIAEESQKNYEEIKKESEAVEKLGQDYDILSKKYENGESTLSQFRTQTRELIKELELENSIIVTLADNYTTLSEKIKQAEISSYKKEAEAAEKNSQAQANSVVADIKADDKTNGYFADDDYIVANPGLLGSQKAYGDFVNSIGERYNIRTSGEFGGYALNTQDLIEEVIKTGGINGALYEELTNVKMQGGADAGAAEKFLDVIDKYSDKITVATEAYQNASTAQYKASLLEDGIQIISDNTQKQNDEGEYIYTEKAEKLDLDSIKTTEDLVDAEKGVERAILAQIQSGDLNTKALKEQYGLSGDMSDRELAKQVAQLQLKEDERINKLYESKAFEDEFNEKYGESKLISGMNLSEKDKTLLIRANLDVDEVTSKKQIQEAIDKIEIESNYEIAVALNPTLEKVQDSLISGDLNMHNIESNEEWKSMFNADGNGGYSDEIKELLLNVPELQNEIDILNNKALVGTQQWSDALNIVQDQLNQMELAGLNQQFDEQFKLFEDYVSEGRFEKKIVKNEKDENGNDKRDKNGQIIQKTEVVTVDIDSEEGMEKFTKQLDELLEADYAINIEIHAQAEDAYEDFMASSDKMIEMADKIGEGYIVAADDIRELNNVFPGIIENFEYTADGSIKLNETVVKNAMESAQAMESASAEATIQELQDDAKKLRAKQASYQTMADIATAASKSEITNSEAVGAIEEELMKIKSLNDAEETNTELSNDQLTAESSKANASTVAQNWSTAYASATKSADIFGKAAAAAHKAGVTGEYSGVSGEFKVDTRMFSGAKDVGTGKTADIKNGTSTTTTEQWKSLAAQYQAAADAAGKQAADIEGMAVGVGGSALKDSTDLKNRGSGKGSGKSSGSSSDADTMDLLNDELDIYHDINIEIEKQEKLLSRLEKEAENLYGQQLIDNLNKQNEALEAENVALEKKHELMLQDIKDRQKVLNAQGVSFDENGQVIDYNGLLAQREAYVNSEIAKYNAMDANSQKAYKNVVEQAKTDYETLKTQLEAYEELVNETLPDLEDTMDEKRKQVLANNLKKWETEIEIHLDLKEAEREWNDFLGDIMADFTKQWEDLDLSFDMNVKDFNTYLGDDGTLATRAQEIKDIEAEIDKLEKTGKSDKYESITQAQEALKQAQKDWMGDVQAFRNAYKAAYDDYMKEIDQIGDKFDSIIDKYKHINELLDFQKDLIGLIYGDEAYGLMSDYYDAQIYNNNSMIDSYKQQLDADRALLSTLKEGDEDYEKVQKRIMENENNMNKLILDNIKLIKEDYANSIKAAADSMMKNITGMSYSAMSEEWDKIKAENVDHFDEIQSMYQIANFESTVKIAIDDAGSIKAQQKLQELYEQEVATLKEREELTQYDIDAANKRLEIAQKEIALEDAQNAKNSMKVVRGTDGNWSYQYVADDDDLESKRQDLANSYAELYDMAKKAEEEAYDNLMNNYDKTVERLVNMVEKGYISEEEFKQAMLQAQEDFELQSERIAERDKIYRQDMLASSVAIANVAYATDAKNFSEKNAEMTKVVEECMTANANSYSDYAKLILDESSPEGLSAIGNQVHTIVSDANPAWTSGIGALAAACGKDSEQKKMIDEFWKDANQAISDYHTKIGDVETKSGTSFGKVKNSIDSCKTSTDSLANATSEVVNQMDALYNKKSVLDEMANQWNNVKGAVESTKNEIDEYLKKVQASIEQTKKDLSSLGAAYANAAQSTTVSSGGNSSGGGGNLTYNSGSTAITYDYVIQSDPNGVYGTYGFYKKGGSLITMSNTEKSLIAEIRKSSNYKKTYKGKKVKTIKYKENGSDIITLATGGYTGEWGAEGKMAMLHEKELVLNKQDTSNILSVVNMVRGIVDGIGGGMLNKLASVANSGVTSNSAMNENSNVVYNVSCEFPNAGDIATIQEAIYTLPDKLTQMFGQRTVR